MTYHCWGKEEGLLWFYASCMSHEYLDEATMEAYRGFNLIERFKFWERVLAKHTKQCTLYWDKKYVTDFEYPGFDRMVMHIGRHPQWPEWYPRMGQADRRKFWYGVLAGAMGIVSVVPRDPSKWGSFPWAKATPRQWPQVKAEPDDEDDKVAVLEAASILMSLRAVKKEES